MEEGLDGTHVFYAERLWPSPIVTVLALCLAAVGGVAYGAAYGAGLGWTVAITLALLLVGALAVTSPRVGVDDRVLRAGRARLPLPAVGSIEALDRRAMLALRRQIDPRSYLLLRPWSARAGVVVTLDDPRDPHPRWLLSSRHPDRLVAAVNAAREDLVGPPAATD